MIMYSWDSSERKAEALLKISQNSNQRRITAELLCEIIKRFLHSYDWTVLLSNKRYELHGDC